MPRLSDAAVAHNRQRQKEIRNKGSNPSRPRTFGRLDTDIKSLERRPFIAWDGEGYRAFRAGPDGMGIEHRYMLFGNSRGYALTDIDLGTQECLELVLSAERDEPGAIHVGFAFEYDVNMILRDLNWLQLGVLHDSGQVMYRGYRIKHTPHKMLAISKNKVSATIFDVFGFFHCSYIKALYKYRIGTEDELARIAAGKAGRSRFTYADIKEVAKYWLSEITPMPELMEAVREAAYSSGFFITQWHGPGALAAYALKQNGARKYKSDSRKVPSDVKVARTSAYAGGRFQDWRAGLYIGPTYTADINSAYAYAATKLPRLDNGSWRRQAADNVNRSNLAHFGLYKIRYRSPLERTTYARDRGIPFPLFHRGKSGHLTWPGTVTGWYWSPEASLVLDDPCAEILEAWIYDSDGTYPFRWMHDAYNRRLSLIETGHPAEKAYKWMLAAIYGQFAQRVGWNKATRQAPSMHQLEWAGYITSYCRAMVYTAAMHVAKQGGLISIDTDGVTSTVPFDTGRLPNGVSTDLGAWKLDSYSGILHWQNGIYWLRDSNERWEEPKSRGVPRGAIPQDIAFDALGRLSFPGVSHVSCTVSRTRFHGYAQALNGQWDKWRTWETEPVEIQFGGTGKGRHVPVFCGKCVTGEGQLHTITHLPPDCVESEPHKLPWLADIPQNVNTKYGIWEDDTL